MVDGTLILSNLLSDAGKNTKHSYTSDEIAVLPFFLSGSFTRQAGTCYFSSPFYEFIFCCSFYQSLCYLSSCVYKFG